MGWRYTLLCLGALCLFVFFLRFVVFRFQESPKFLLYRGKDEKAVKVLQHIAKFNGRQSNITLDIFKALDRAESTSAAQTTTQSDEEVEQLKDWKHFVKIEFLRYKTLFSTPNMARLTVLIWITCKHHPNPSSKHGQQSGRSNCFGWMLQVS